MLTDRGGTYVTVTLTCGHDARVDAVMLAQHPTRAFWCRACADLHPVAQEQS